MQVDSTHADDEQRTTLGPDEEFRRRRIRRAIWLLPVVGFAIVAAAVARIFYSHEQPPPTVSKDTTFFTGPLTDDGYVNYVAAIEQLTQTKSIQRDDDPVWSLLRVAAPYSGGGQTLLAPPEFLLADVDDVFASDRNICAELQLAPLPLVPDEGKRWSKLMEAYQPWFESLRKAADQPWSLPQAGASPLQNYYRSDHDYRFTQILGCRIQWFAGQRATDEAFDEIDVLRKLADRHPKHPEPMVDRVSLTMETAACLHAAVVMLHCRDVRPEFERWVDALPASPDLAAVRAHFNLFQRLSELGAVQAAALSLRPEISTGSWHRFATTVQRRWKFVPMDVDWLLTELNDQFDQFSEDLFHHEDWPACRAALQRAWEARPNVFPLFGRTWRDLGFTRYQDYFIAKSYVTGLGNRARPLLRSHFRLAAAYRMVRVSLALHRWRLQHETFPQSLRELVDNGFIDERWLDDPFCPGQDFRYELTERYGRLYTVGPNQEDDLGIPTHKDVPASLLPNGQRPGTGRYPDDWPGIIWRR